MSKLIVYTRKDNAATRQRLGARLRVIDIKPINEAGENFKFQQHFVLRSGLGEVRDKSVPSAWLAEVDYCFVVQVIDLCSIAFGQLVQKQN